MVAPLSLRLNGGVKRSRTAVKANTAGIIGQETEGHCFLERILRRAEKGEQRTRKQSRRSRKGLNVPKLRWGKHFIPLRNYPLRLVSD